MNCLANAVVAMIVGRRIVAKIGKMSGLIPARGKIVVVSTGVPAIAFTWFR